MEDFENTIKENTINRFRKAVEDLYFKEIFKINKDIETFKSELNKKNSDESDEVLLLKDKIINNFILKDKLFNAFHALKLELSAACKVCKKNNIDISFGEDYLCPNCKDSFYKQNTVSSGTIHFSDKQMDELFINLTNN